MIVPLIGLKRPPQVIPESIGVHDMCPMTWDVTPAPGLESLKERLAYAKIITIERASGPIGNGSEAR